MKRMARQNVCTLKTNMAKENVNLDFRLKKIYQRTNSLLEEIRHNDLLSKKHKKVDRVLNYFKNFVFVSAVGGCVSIFVCTSLVCVPVGISSSAVERKNCAIKRLMH